MRHSGFTNRLSPQRGQCSNSRSADDESLPALDLWSYTGKVKNKTITFWTMLKVPKTKSHTRMPLCSVHKRWGSTRRLSDDERGNLVLPNFLGEVGWGGFQELSREGSCWLAQDRGSIRPRLSHSVDASYFSEMGVYFL